MTLASAALGEDGATYNGKDLREFVEAIFYDVPGVVFGSAVTQQGSPDDTVKVAAGAAVIVADGAGLGGMYHHWYDSEVTSPTITPTTSNGRKDRLIWRVTNGTPALEVVEGTPSGSPAEPAITGNNYEELALITLPTSTSAITDAMITDRRRFSSAIGGWMIRNAADSVADPEARPFFYAKDTGRFYGYDRTAEVWDRLGIWDRASGRTGVTARRSNTNQTLTSGTTTAVSFDVETFDSDGYISVPSSTPTVPAGFGGLYDLGWHITAQDSNNNDRFEGFITVNGGVQRFRSNWPSGRTCVAGTSGMGAGGAIRLSAGDVVRLYCTWDDFSSFTSDMDITAQLDLYRVGP